MGPERAGELEDHGADLAILALGVRRGSRPVGLDVMGGHQEPEHPELRVPGGVSVSVGHEILGRRGPERADLDPGLG